MSRQTLALFGAASLIAGWMLASTASPPVAQTQGSPARRAAPVVAPAPSFEALQRRVNDVPPAPRPQRNPFVFDGMRPDTRQPLPVMEPEWTVEPDLAVPPVAPPLQLVGVAGNVIDGGIVRTAILSDGREMWLLAAGDTLPDGTSVVRVDEEAVVLADPAGVERVLRLR
jgi:hypothetical protein